VNVDAGISSAAAARQFRLIWLFLLAAGIIMLDQMTKALAVASLEYAVPHTVFTGFDLLLVHNYGAAFSFLGDQAGWQRWLLAAIAAAASIFICVWLARLPRHQVLLGVALACILGGALGNLYDRVVMGYVVDFISLYYHDSRFATFNIADVALNIGAALIVLDVLLNRKQTHD
jgi:signal peptidase II